MPYMRYFLARIFQFQFHRALCEAAGQTGPLHECSIYGNKEAGEAAAGDAGDGRLASPGRTRWRRSPASARWTRTAILDYFAPLQKWLEEQNKGQKCGW